MEKYKSQIAPNPKVELIHVSMDEKEAAATKWAIEGKFPWPTLLGKHYEPLGLGEFGAFAGESYLIDRDGKVVTTDENEAFTKIAALK